MLSCAQESYIELDRHNHEGALHSQRLLADMMKYLDDHPSATPAALSAMIQDTVVTAPSAPDRGILPAASTQAMPSVPAGSLGASVCSRVPADTSPSISVAKTLASTGPPVAARKTLPRQVANMGTGERPLIALEGIDEPVEGVLEDDDELGGSAPAATLSRRLGAGKVTRGRHPSRKSANSQQINTEAPHMELPLRTVQCIASTVYSHIRQNAYGPGRMGLSFRKLQVDNTRHTCTCALFWYANELQILISCLR